MALVAYSDSEHSSEDEAPSVKSVHTPQPPSSASTKPAFKKVVDGSNPHKIRVNLPAATSQREIVDDIEQPAAKRARRAGGGAGTFSGFNALLPAPKRTGPAAAGGAGSRLSAGKGRGLGAGISLKTGAAPGFSRAPEPERESFQPAGEDVSVGATSGERADATSGSTTNTSIAAASTDEQKPMKKPMMFKPLSVARKQKKRPIKPPVAASSDTAAASFNEASTASSTAPPARQSLFSLSANDSSSNHPSAPTPARPYEPLLYAPEPESNTREQEEPPDEDTDFLPVSADTHQSSSAPQPSIGSSLSDVASDLNLSRSAKRQLLGRNGTLGASQVLEFNTDKEYAANDEIRRNADANAIHNPVKAIAPGKHSLKQLVTAASGQRDALEESFAAGRRNRKEAGSKYGW